MSSWPNKRVPRGNQVHETAGASRPFEGTKAQLRGYKYFDPATSAKYQTEAAARRAKLKGNTK